MSSLKYRILLISLLIITSMELQAKSYNSWHLLYQDTYGVIKKVKDSKNKKTVIEFQSKTSRDTYINGAKTGKKSWNNTKDKTIRWDFNFNKNFVIMVSLKTKDGYRDLVYTSGDDNGNLYFGLGKHIISGTWQTITRNLENDLHKYEPSNEIISVNAFIIRGSGKIGKIEMLGFQKKETEAIEPKVEVIIKKVEEKIKDILRKEQKEKEQEEREKEEQQKQEKEHDTLLMENTVVYNSLLPRIILEEGSLIYHKLGEPFFEPGATATDYSGIPIDIDTIGEVDINKVNRYVLTYIATDENGYTSTKARVIMVHKVGEEVHKKQVNLKSMATPNSVKENMLKYEELLDLTPLDEGSELDEDLMYYD
ncbi:MAG: DUF5011 domain-containing protein [Sulfurovaceae bacterium]|nr:DUF5011 domain-containing protein [Sulfurovaceae bacterium]